VCGSEVPCFFVKQKQDEVFCSSGFLPVFSSAFGSLYLGCGAVLLIIERRAGGRGQGHCEIRSRAHRRLVLVSKYFPDDIIDTKPRARSLAFPHSMCIYQRVRVLVSITLWAGNIFGRHALC